MIIVAPIRIFAACIAAKVAKGIAKGDIEKGEQPEGYKADDVIGTIKIMVSMALVIILFPTYATGESACYSLPVSCGFRIFYASELAMLCLRLHRDSVFRYSAILTIPLI